MSKDSPIWSPTTEAKQTSSLAAFYSFIAQKKGARFPNYKALYQWSVSDLNGFWGGLAEFFEVAFSKPYTYVLKIRKPFYKTVWFEGGEVSYCHHIERNFRNGGIALVYGNEAGDLIEITWNALIKRAVAIKTQLEVAGIGKGDCVGGYLHYHPESIAAFLATNALGAIWSCCSPDFGTESVINRLGQLRPKILLAVESYTYNGKKHQLKEKIAILSSAMSSVETTLCFEGNLSHWDLRTKEKYSLEPVSVSFDHPIWVLFSSGTTGPPKAITHRTGGMLLEQMKALVLHQNVQAGDRFFWHTSTGWMMWNYAVGALLCGATLCIYDGSPAYPELGVQWRFAQQAQVNHFGHGAPFFIQSMKSYRPEWGFQDLTNIKTIGSTGAPLTEEAFRWLQKQLPRAQIISLSGGTDVCSAFIGGNPMKPVYAGYLQDPMLGAAVEAWNSSGKAVESQTAELVLTQPMPCMPLYFWNDPENKRYHKSYFNAFDGVWTHGDWIRIDPQKGIQIQGRSDATLNKNGIRMGTAELYQALDSLDFLQDHLIVDVIVKNGVSELFLFVVISAALTPNKEKEIKACIRKKCSPRHVPDRIFKVIEVPYTLSGKKLEIPVKKIMMGAPLHAVANVGSLRNPDALEEYAELYQTLSP